MYGFPAALTSFIGRRAALREVVGLLERYRLVTVTGPGGSGKTRLAGEAARAVAGRFADGTWLAELAPVRDPGQVQAAVAAALEVREQPGVPAAEALARVLARQQLLLVLDNCEHVIAAAAELCATLLAACDDVRVLATSREPLAVTGEARYRLGPLSLPAPDGEAGASEAVALFAERARAVDARFTLCEQTGSAVARLVTRLDGLPLAIELAAARVEALGLTQLDQRFSLLGGTDRLAGDRHRSLAATADWSYRLLSGPEQRVFRVLAAFPGPFTLEAAEAVAGPGAAPAVLHLVDCCLLSPPRAGPDGRDRYLMLETLRGYGATQLAEAGEQHATAAAVAAYALRVAGQAAEGLQDSAGEVAAARWLDAEDATMRQALAWAAEHDAGVALELVTALGWWWFLRGRLAGEYPLMCRAVERAMPGSDGWYGAQFWVGWTAQLSGDLAAALSHFTALRDAAGPQPSRALADALAGRAAALLNLGRRDEAGAAARSALAMARGIGYPAGELLALGNLSVAASERGEHDSAVRLARQAEQIQAGVPRPLTRVSSDVLTNVLIAAGDLPAAERVCAAALARARDAGDLFNQVDLLEEMGLLDVQADRIDDATAHLRGALQAAVRSGSASLLDTLDGCGHLCAAAGRRAEAVAVWAAYTALLPDGYTDPPPSVLRRLEPLRKAREAIGPARAQAAEERGAAMSLATAVEYALMLTALGRPPEAAPPGLLRLSARERELITLVARGRTDAQIAELLFISVRTVRSHLDRIRDKTGCRRRADLTRIALQAHLV